MVNKFTIIRSEWLRGEGCEASFLYREDGKRCCVGFYLNACGISDERLEDKPEASSLEKDEPAQAKWLDNNVLVYTTNDDEGYTDAEREARLKLLFEAQGIALEFVD